MNLSVMMAYGIPSKHFSNEHSLYNNISAMRVPFSKPWYKEEGNFDKSLD